MKRKGKISKPCKKCDFGFRHYREILNLFKKGGYKFCFFGEKPDQKVKRVYLRHDVDFSLEKALQLAKIENRARVRSTYFIRLSAPFYNIFDPVNLEIIKEINNLGHRIGLHYEGDITNKMTIEREVSRQIQILRSYFKVGNVVSFHRPSKFVLGREFGEFVSTYQSEFFKKIKYLSDSKGKWREGCICQWLKSDSPPKNLQVLLHPIWWGRKERDANLHLQQWLREKFKYLDQQLYRDSEPYKKKLF